MDSGSGLLLPMRNRIRDPGEPIHCGSMWIRNAGNPTQFFLFQRTDQASEGCGGGADGDGGEQVRPSHQEYRHATGQGRSQVSGIAQDFRYFEDSSRLKILFEFE